jgi:Zn-dependent protease
MFRSWKFGTAFGIPLFIHSTFVLLPAWVLGHAVLAGPGLSPGVVLYLLASVAAVTACIVLHELGHALTARAFGIGTRDITLYPIGGVARLERMSENPAEELAIAVAGPAVNVLIAVLLTPVMALLSPHLGGAGSDLLLPTPGMSPAEVLARFVLALWGTNVILVLFNLIPAFPMDGGRVLRALLSLVLGQLRGTEIAVRIALVLAVVLALLGVIFWRNPFLAVIALFVCWGGQQELLALRYREARRRAAAPPPALAPAGVRPAEPVARPAQGFTGILWDGQFRVWVRWHDGRPVAYWSPAE